MVLLSRDNERIGELGEEELPKNPPRRRMLRGGGQRAWRSKAQRGGGKMLLRRKGKEKGGGTLETLRERD